MESPPPEPTGGPPFERRFTGASYNSFCEYIEWYRPGVYHPVDIDDEYAGGRYRIIRKLGFGASSTVWLARDTVKSRFVAFKVMSAKLTSSYDKQESFLQKLQDCKELPGFENLLLPEETFCIKGPNGVHMCNVLEPAAISIGAFYYCSDRVTNVLFRQGGNEIFQSKYANKIFLDVLQGLALLHKNGMVHGDVSHDNILLSATGINSIPEHTLKQPGPPYGNPIVRLDGKPDKWAPRELNFNNPLLSHTCTDHRMSAKLADIEKAFWASDPPEFPASISGLRAPELIFSGKLGPAMDIWAFGCLVYEFLVGTELFGHRNYKFHPTFDDADDSVIQRIWDAVGPFPVWLRDKWTRVDKYYDADGNKLTEGGKPLVSYSGEESPEAYPSLEENFMDRKPEEMDENEAKAVISLLRDIFKYDPAERPSAEDLLQHPYFQNCPLPGQDDQQLPSGGETFHSGYTAGNAATFSSQTIT